MIRTQVDIDLRDAESQRIAVTPRGHRTQGDATPHIVLSLVEHSKVSIALDLAGAQQLVMDLVEAIALARKPRAVQEGGT